MAATSVPKVRLVSLILDDLKAVTEAKTHFHILEDDKLHGRLQAFTKPQLLAFILGLGAEAEIALQQLQTRFPLRRPPTFYITIVNSCPALDDLVKSARSLSKKSTQATLTIGSDAPIRRVSLGQPGKVIDLKGQKVICLEFQYDRRLEICQAEPESEHYGEIEWVYSMEPAFVWIPSGKHKHAVIACCDYPALRHILGFLNSRLNIRLSRSRFDTKMLQRISQGAIPRSATFTLVSDATDTGEVQTVTLSDPMLHTKAVFTATNEEGNREQTAGFYTSHAGLTLGGIGIARRDSKVWTPKRLDNAETAKLALTLIEQVESALGKIKDVRAKIKYYYSRDVEIGGTRLSSNALKAWQDLADAVLLANASEEKEHRVPRTVLERWVHYQHKLGLLTALEYECGTCGVRQSLICPDCFNVLEVKHGQELELYCASCRKAIDRELECDCGASIEYDILTAIQLVPTRELLQSVIQAGAQTKSVFNGFFVVTGDLVKVVAHKQVRGAKRLTLMDLGSWRTQAKFHTRTITPSVEHSRLAILCKTKEKCRRDGARPSHERCDQCNAGELQPQWITNGQTCLARLFGVAIDQPMDGVHYGAEQADILYEDTVFASGKHIQIGIHVKSRKPKEPPDGMGRSQGPIKGLYTQLAFSAYKARQGEIKLDAIGVAMPNTFHKDVLDSMEYVANTLGFPLIVVDGPQWIKVIDAAVEQTALAEQATRDTKPAQPRSKKH